VVKDFEYQLPVIRVDDAHFQVDREDSRDPEIYKLPVGPGFILDATGYTFHAPPGLESVPPNLIQLVRGAGQTYGHPWREGKTRYVMTGDTLKPARGCVTLRMFEAGEVLILAIGRFFPPEGPMEEGKFYTYWVTMIYVF
jgi:hypothetical protein